MAYLGLRSENSKLVTCPYNSTHQIMQSRLQVHLCRCRRNYANSNKVKCPFNITHIVNEPELNYHVLNCESRKELEQYKYQLQTSEPSPHLCNSTTFAPIECDENWDDENHESYNPAEYVKNAPVVRLIKGVTPSEKKQFRISEQKRLHKLYHAKKDEEKKRAQKK